jgi:D-alanine-D-alanine ligase
MNKLNVAIVSGGYDAERIISLKSANVVKANLNPLKYNTWIIDITREAWFDIDSKIEIDKNNFSLQSELPIFFDVVFMCLHGSPAEDGKIQGYFEMLQIPYTGCDARSSAITMDKIFSKKIAHSILDIKTARFVEVMDIKNVPLEEIKKIGLPLFVKPNDAGSSFGVSKVKNWDELMPAIEEAMKHSKRTVVEEYISGRELAQGVFESNGKLLALPITEVVSENEFFDFEAKYEGKSKELTPAPNISIELEAQISQHSIDLFIEFGCRGLTRIDYFLRGEEIFFLEANTLPGLSEASIFPQQLVCKGITLQEAFESLLLSSFKNK